MPFREYQSTLDPNALVVLTEAFDAAWSDLQASSGYGMAEEVAARDMLARRLIAAAIKLGAEDAEKLKSMALEGLTH